MEIDFAQNGGDLGSLAAGPPAQVCIIGGGIAGLVLAHRLAGQGIDVLLLEAGGRSREHATVFEPAVAELAGDPHLGTSLGRNFVLGGSSISWGGQFLPMLDATSWPISTSMLSPYYRAAEALLGVDDLPYTDKGFFSAIGQTAPALSLAFPNFIPRLSKFAPFTRRNLGSSLGRELLRSRHARVVLNAQVREIELTAGGDRVQAVVLRTPSGEHLLVRARQFVLAAGAVESARLLLVSRSTAAEGVGNAHDQVGRNFHDHLTVRAAIFGGAARARIVRQFRPWIIGGLKGTLHALKLECDHELRDRLGLNHAQVHFAFEEPETSGIAALRSLLLAHQRSTRPRTRSGLRDLPGVINDTFELYQEAHHAHRRYLSPDAKVSLRLNVAQESPSLARVRLAETLDASGQPRAQVNWRIHNSELWSLRTLAKHLHFRFEQLGFSSVEDTGWMPELLAGHRPFHPLATPGELMEGISDDQRIPGLEDARHAMGGACMGTDPRTSVVDPQLRVHGLRNLSIASAAVFPDGSPQLPTLTLMALSLRLAQRLEGELSRRS